MKVSKCSESKASPVERELLDGKQIKEREDIYKFARSPDSPDRAIVIHGSVGAIILWLTDTGIKAADFSATKFLRTNETLCMEVRPESDSE